MSLCCIEFARAVAKSSLDIPVNSSQLIFSTTSIREFNWFIIFSSVSKSVNSLLPLIIRTSFARLLVSSKSSALKPSAVMAFASVSSSTPSISLTSFVISFVISFATFSTDFKSAFTDVFALSSEMLSSVFFAFTVFDFATLRLLLF